MAEKWKNSEAKCLLHDDIISGDVPASMEAKDIYNMRPEYKNFEYSKFRTNLKNLRETIAKGYRRMQMDCEAYGHDRAVLKELQAANPQYIAWHESEAKMLLKQDIDEGKHHQLKPSELHASREHYKTFSLKVFRNHIYQEVDSRSKRAQRFANKKTRSRREPIRLDT
jgi:hypothetical protein